MKNHPEATALKDRACVYLRESLNTLNKALGAINNQEEFKEQRDLLLGWALEVGVMERNLKSGAKAGSFDPSPAWRHWFRHSPDTRVGILSAFEDPALTRMGGDIGAVYERSDRLDVVVRALAADRAVSDDEPTVTLDMAKPDPLRTALEAYHNCKSGHYERMEAVVAAFAPPADRAELAKEAKRLAAVLIHQNCSREALAECQAAIDALARSTDAPSEPVAWQARGAPDMPWRFCESRETYENLRARGYEVRALAALATPPAAAMSTPYESGPECLTCSDSGIVGLCDRAEPCPDCTPPGSLAAAAQAPAVPAGWKLLKDSTQDERSWQEDAAAENGNYFNACATCLRMFVGHKRRVTCKVCAICTPTAGNIENASFWTVVPAGSTIERSFEYLGASHQHVPVVLVRLPPVAVKSSESKAAFEARDRLADALTQAASTGGKS